jgi:hypothetical protein
MAANRNAAAIAVQAVCAMIARKMPNFTTKKQRIPMIYSFETEETKENFVINTATMRWGIASSILSAPSIVAAEHNMAKFEFSKEGELVAMGAGVYNLDGRTPKDGLSTVGILCIPFENTLVIYLRANAKIKDGTFKSNPIQKTEYMIMQDKQAEPAVVAAE